MLIVILKTMITLELYMEGVTNTDLTVYKL